jgi:PAS domain S-box-containing protein
VSIKCLLVRAVRCRTPDAQTHPATSGLLAMFCLGTVFGLAANILDSPHFAAAAVILAAIFLLLTLLSRLAERSDVRLLAGDLSYRAFFDNAIEGIFRTTPDGHYLDANPALARIYGYDSPSALQKGLTDISSQLYVDPNRRDEFKAAMRKFDRVTDFVSEIHRRDGSTIWISENARAVRDWSGRLLCYEGTVEDVTQKFAAQRAIKKGLERAEEANRAKNAFLAMMSHELKTPLNAIIGFSELIAGEMLGPLRHEGYRGYVGDILSSGRKLLAIINDVLDVARLEGDSVTLNRSAAGARYLAQCALERARAATGDGRAVAFDIPPGLPDAEVDPARFAQALGNILANALKFTPKDSEAGVSLRVRQGADGGLVFTVGDRGIGMAAEAIEAALEPFRQIDNSLSRRFEGAGLGLPIAKALVELHGGRLAIESAVGYGTRVTIVLPPRPKAGKSGRHDPLASAAQTR